METTITPHLATLITIVLASAVVGAGAIIQGATVNPSPRKLPAFAFGLVSISISSLALAEWMTLLLN